jgi:YihY family inner membrane protein
VSTSTRVPETSNLSGDELDASDARTTLRRFGRQRLAIESFRRFRHGDGFSHARALGLQFVLALIPMTIALVGLSSVVHAEELGKALRTALVGLAPGSSDQLVRDTLTQGMSQADAGPLALWLGLATALVALTTAMGQVERGANRIYGIQRDRPSAAKYARAAALAIVAGVPMMLGFLVLLAGEKAITALAEAYAWSGPMTDVLLLVRWPIGLLLDLLAITALMRWAPRRRQPGFSWMTVGSAVALLLWVLFTWLLGMFVTASGSFGAVYGPLTAFMALVIWAMLSGVALLLGIAFAAQLEAVRAGVTDGALPDPEQSTPPSPIGQSESPSSERPALAHGGASPGA